MRPELAYLILTRYAGSGAAHSQEHEMLGNTSAAIIGVVSGALGGFFLYQWIVILGGCR